MNAKSFILGASTAAVFFGLYVKQEAQKPLTTSSGLSGVLDAAQKLASLKDDTIASADQLINWGTAIGAIVMLLDD